MNFRIKIDSPARFEPAELNDFLLLLKEQGQVDDPNLNKIQACSWLVIVYSETTPVGIGAIKNVYKRPFEKAGVSDLQSDYECELGYFYVRDKPEIRDTGFAKLMSKMLLKKVNGQPVFATTEEADTNRMKFVLESLKFEKTGSSFKGAKTGKTIALYTLK